MEFKTRRICMDGHMPKLTKIFCITGKAGHGKDTLASYMKSSLEERGNAVLVIHNADLLKHICQNVFGWNGEKDEAGRTFLQCVGTDVVRAQNPDFWVNFIMSILRLFPDYWDYVIIPDCRFPNEIDRLKEEGFDVVAVKVVRDGKANSLSEAQAAHPSETAMDAYPCDWTLHCRTKNELYNAAYAVLNKECGVNSLREVVYRECESEK